MDHKEARNEVERTAMFRVLALLTLNERTDWAAELIALETMQRCCLHTHFDEESL